MANPAHAFTATITNSPASIYLQVGVGNFGNGFFTGGTAAGNNALINQVTATVPAGSLGGGPVGMTTNSTITRSSYDHFVFCTVPAQVYFGGFLRSGNNAASTATLSATAPAALVNAAGDSIAFNTVSWVSGGNADPVATIPSGTFTGATQTLLNMGSNTWFESCLQFSYSNSQLVGAGTYSGRVRYTLTAP